MAFNGKTPSLLELMALGAVEDSKRWFPDTHGNVPFHVLCIAGEVGELANLIKKIERGTLNYSDPKVRYDVAMEVTDIFTYLINLAGLLRINLEASYNVKRRENESRFGGSSKTASNDGSSSV